MGKSRQAKSPGSFHGYHRARSGSYKAIDSKKSGVKPKTRSLCVSDIRSRLRSHSKALALSPANSNDSFLDDEIANSSSHAALSAINGYVRELETALTEVERSLITPRAFSRPLLSSTRDDLNDELDCDELLITAIRVIVLDPEESVIQDKVYVEHRLQDLGGRTYPADSSPPPELRQLKFVDGGDSFNRQFSIAVDCPLPLSPEESELVSEQPKHVETAAATAVEPDPPSLPPNQVALVTMASEPPSAVERAADRYIEATMIWEEDYVRADFNNLPLKRIQDLADQAVSQQQELRAAYLAVRKIPVADLGEIESLQNVTNLSAKFVQFRDKAYAVIAANKAEAKNDTSHNNTVMSHMSAATEECITNSVNTRKDGIISNGNNVITQLMELVDVRPNTTQGFVELESKLETLKLQAKDALDALKELAAAATSVGNGDAAMLLTETSDKLISARTQASTSVKAAKAALGIPEGGINRQVQVSIKAPVFKGDFKEQLDWFSFEKKLE